MENQTLPDLQPIEPLPQSPVPSKTHWLKILVITALGLFITAASVFVGIQIGKSKIFQQQPVTVQPTSTPAISTSSENPPESSSSATTIWEIEKPTLGNWKTYENNDISFEYPDFMENPKDFFSNAVYNDIRSIYAWRKTKSGYANEIEIWIQGPWKNTATMDLSDWMEVNGYQTKTSKGYEVPLMIDVTQQFISGKLVILQTTNVYAPEVTLPFGWRAFFNSRDGIYFIDVRIQATEEETALYQGLSPHILDTLRIKD